MQNCGRNPLTFLRIEPIPVRRKSLTSALKDKGVTPRGWFVSEVLGRPEDGTEDSGRFPISQDFWGGWKGGSRRRGWREF